MALELDGVTNRSKPGRPRRIGAARWISELATRIKSVFLNADVDSRTEESSNCELGPHQPQPAFRSGNRSPSGCGGSP